MGRSIRFVLTGRASLTPPGAETARLEGHTSLVSWLAVLPDGRLASAQATTPSGSGPSGSGTRKPARRRQGSEGHTSSVSALAVLPDGRLTSGSGDNTIRLWDAKTGQETARLEVDFAVYCLAVLSDKRLAAGGGGGRIHWLEIVD